MRNTAELIMHFRTVGVRPPPFWRWSIVADLSTPLRAADYGGSHCRNVATQVLPRDMTRNTRTILRASSLPWRQPALRPFWSSASSSSAAGCTCRPRIGVVVASHPLANGALITPSDVKLVGWPADALAPGSFSKVEDVANRGITSVLENEPLTDSKPAVGAGAGLFQPSPRNACDLGASE